MPITNMEFTCELRHSNPTHCIVFSNFLSKLVILEIWLQCIFSPCQATTIRPLLTKNFLFFYKDSCNARCSSILANQDKLPQRTLTNVLLAIFGLKNYVDFKRSASRKYPGTVYQEILNKVSNASFEPHYWFCKPRWSPKVYEGYKDVVHGTQFLDISDCE